MIKIVNLSKKYDQTVILKHANYKFPQNGIVCLMGASGSGKTTLFNLLAGFDTEYEGDITVGGTSICKMNQDVLCAYRKDNIGFVFQNYHLLSGYTVLENVMLACGLSKKSREANMEKAKTILKRLDLTEKMAQPVETLSGGQKQRVAIARALMNNPKIIFADEPTGALDRKTATEIMALFQEISTEKLVVVITHDEKISSFADEIIRINNQKIIVEQSTVRPSTNEKSLKIGKTVHPNLFAQSFKNFRVHLKRYLAVSLAISIGLLAFLFSLSFGNAMEQSIAEFKEKNTAFSSGYIKGTDDNTVLNYLKSDERIKNVYYQYKLSDINLLFGEKNVEMAEKFPGPKATENLSYGVMPRQGKNEISITPSLAKKFDNNIKNLIGKNLTLKYGEEKYVLTICGIFNAGYDDFFISSDVELRIYKKISGQKNYSISYEVPEFSNIVPVNNTLMQHGLDIKSAAEEVYALQNTFDNLQKLFLIISLLVLVICIFICLILLYKLQNSRYHEVGLLSALGFKKHQIFYMVTVENFLLSSLAIGVNFGLLICYISLCELIKLPFIVTGTQVLLSVIFTFIIVVSLSTLASRKLLYTEPAKALRI